MNLLLTAVAVLVLNLPFGYWRANVRKLSLQWFLAIHVPVPGIVALRVLSGLGWQLVSFPVLVGSFFVGQLLGSKWHAFQKRRHSGRASSCLVVDLLTNLRSFR